MDLLAAISDPLTWPVIMAFLIGLSMFPVGIFLPCSGICACCPCEMSQLPETVSVTFSNMPRTGPSDFYVTFQVTSSNFFLYEMATGTVTAPGETAGAITETRIDDPGSGFARLGRVEPTLTLSGSGSGATFSVTLSEGTDLEGLPNWTATSASVSGGTGYTDGENLNVSAPDAIGSPPSFTLQTGRSEPTVTADLSAASGTGADLTVSLSQTTDFNGRTVWEVSSVTVNNSGSGYVDGDLVLVSPDGDAQSSGTFFGTVVTDGSGGIASVTIDSAGEYYLDNGVPDAVVIDYEGDFYEEDPDEEPLVATLVVSIFQVTPDGNGDGGSDGTGAVLTPVVDTDTASPTFGQITGMTIDNGGSNYLAFEQINAKCCDTHYDDQTLVLKAINNDDNPRAGSLQATLDSACVRQYAFCGAGSLVTASGRDLVSDYGNAYGMGVVWLHVNDDKTISVSLRNADHGDPDHRLATCDIDWTSPDPVETCREFSFTATDSDTGAEISVSTGGEYDPDKLYGGPYSCHSCCRGTDEVPEEIEVTITNPPGQSATSPLPDGNYVLSITSSFFPAIGVLWSGFFVEPNPNLTDIDSGIDVRLMTCATALADGWTPAFNAPGCAQATTEDPFGFFDTCFEECIVHVTASFEFGLNGSVCGQGTCFASPACAPPSGTIDLIDQNNIPTVLMTITL